MIPAWLAEFKRQCYSISNTFHNPEGERFRIGTINPHRFDMLYLA